MAMGYGAWGIGTVYWVLSSPARAITNIKYLNSNKFIMSTCCCCNCHRFIDNNNGKHETRPGQKTCDLSSQKSWQKTKRERENATCSITSYNKLIKFFYCRHDRLLR